MAKAAPKISALRSAWLTVDMSAQTAQQEASVFPPCSSHRHRAMRQGFSDFRTEPNNSPVIMPSCRTRPQIRSAPFERIVGAQISSSGRMKCQLEPKTSAPVSMDQQALIVVMMVGFVNTIERTPSHVPKATLGMAEFTRLRPGMMRAVVYDTPAEPRTRVPQGGQYLLPAGQLRAMHSAVPSATDYSGNSSGNRTVAKSTQN